MTKILDTNERIRKTIKMGFLGMSALWIPVILASNIFFARELERYLEKQNEFIFQNTVKNFSTYIIDDIITNNIFGIEQSARRLLLENNIGKIILYKESETPLLIIENQNGQIKAIYTASETNNQENTTTRIGLHPETRANYDIKIGEHTLANITALKQIEGTIFPAEFLTIKILRIVTIIFVIGYAVHIAISRKLSNIIISSIQNLENETHLDKLTEIPNRRAIIEYIDNKITNSQKFNLTFSVCFIDVDNLKKINDELGHEAGDELIRSTAQKLKSILREHDFVGRLAGDEFIAVIDNIDDLYNLENILNRNDTLNLNSAEKNEELIMTCSIGSSRFPHDGITTKELISKADKAMYRAKKIKSKSK